MPTASLLASAAVRSQLVAELDSVVDSVERVAREIYDRPELAYQEIHASRLLTHLLESRGFGVERGSGGVDTAFTATTGSGELVVALCAEYDALPEVGHACGHHLIAGAAVAAALALQPLCDVLGIQVRVIGTPAEETGGGKVDLLTAGAFGDVHLAAMVHFGSGDISPDPAGSSSQVVGRFRTVFAGRGSHAAAAPQLGINAGDAAVVAHVALGLLRQQMPSDQRASAITITAGTAINIIPERSVVDFECRAWNMADYEELRRRVLNCFTGAALATGTALEVEPTQHLYDALAHDAALSARWAAALADLGYDLGGERIPGGSTDMGNVSQYVPSIHPFVVIPGAQAAIHTVEFARAANTPEAYHAMKDSALALAGMIAATAESGSERGRLETLRETREPYRPFSPRWVRP